MRKYGLLREKIKNTFGTIGAFCDEFGQSRSSVSNKLNGIVPWRQTDIEKACELLRIDPEQIARYFFYSE